MYTGCQEKYKKEALRMNKEESKQIFEDLFGSNFQTGLDQPDQFDRCAPAVTDYWKYGSKKTSRVSRIF